MKAGLLFAATIGLAAGLPAPVAQPNLVLEDVEIWVNEEGQALSKTTIASTEIQTPTHAMLESQTPTPANTYSVSSVPTHSSALQPTVSPSASVPPPHSTPSQSTTTLSAPPSSSSSPLDFNTGMAYSPYLANNACKSAQQVATDFAQLKSYDVFRVYGTDCNQVSNVLAAMHSINPNAKLFAGIYDWQNPETETQTIISAVNASPGGWSKIHTVSVGNEVINFWPGNVSAMVSAVGSTRTALRKAGYTGPVVTVDTMVALSEHAELCQASDYCAMNCHAFFDGGWSADQAGQFVQMWIGKVQAVAGGKQIILTESGWPSQGQTNKKAVPGVQEQKDAMASLTKAFPNNFLQYTAYNNYWLQDTPSTFGTQHYWGLFGDAPGGK